MSSYLYYVRMELSECGRASSSVSSSTLENWIQFSSIFHSKIELKRFTWTLQFNMSKVPISCLMVSLKHFILLMANLHIWDSTMNTERHTAVTQCVPLYLYMTMVALTLTLSILLLLCFLTTSFFAFVHVNIINNRDKPQCYFWEPQFCNLKNLQQKYYRVLWHVSIIIFLRSQNICHFSCKQ